MGIPWYVICYFSPIAFNIFSLIFVSLSSMCLSMFLLGLILYGTLSFLDLGNCFLSHVMEVFRYYVFKYFLRLFPSLFSFWDPYNVNIGVFDFVPVVSKTVLVSFHSFFFLLFCSSDFHHSVF